MPEPPSIHPLDDTELDDGLVLCVEPAVEHEGANFVVEEQCVIRGGQLERLSPPAPRELIDIAL
jgi:Xaa-Pro dipeptidase